MAPNTDIIRHVRECMEPVESGEATQDQVCALLDRAGALKEYVRELDRQVKDAVIAWIEQHGDFEIGTVRYYVGKSTYSKVKDNRRAVALVLDAADGDLEAMADALRSDAWKTSVIDHLLGPDNDLVERTVVPDLKTGKPKKDMKKIDTRFVRRIDDANG